MTKWNVQIGQTVMEVSADLCVALGYEGPYANDETRTAKYYNPFTRANVPGVLVEACAAGLTGDEAALRAVAVASERRAMCPITMAWLKAGCHLLVAMADAEYTYAGLSPEEWAANTHLMAAAPKLLEALKEALRWLENDEPYTLKDAQCETKHEAALLMLTALQEAERGGR